MKWGNERIFSIGRCRRKSTISGRRRSWRPSPLGKELLAGAAEWRLGADSHFDPLWIKGNDRDTCSLVRHPPVKSRDISICVAVNGRDSSSERGGSASVALLWLEDLHVELLAARAEGAALRRAADGAEGRVGEAQRASTAREGDARGYAAEANTAAEAMAVQLEDAAREAAAQGALADELRAELDAAAARVEQLGSELEATRDELLARGAGAKREAVAHARALDELASAVVAAEGACSRVKSAAGASAARATEFTRGARRRARHGQGGSRGRRQRGAGQGSRGARRDRGRRPRDRRASHAARAQARRRRRRGRGGARSRRGAQARRGGGRARRLATQGARRDFNAPLGAEGTRRAGELTN
jgi:hypothetical protein